LTKYIPLSSGKNAIVDDDDYEWLSVTKWADDSSGYAIRKVKGKTTTEKMHRLIIDVKEGEHVDHINGIPWDNRKENLRIATARQNAANKGPYSTNKSGYKGVAVYKNGRWTAQITVNYRKLHLGCFDDPKEAALAYNEAAIAHFGEYAKLNDI
jgi:hypothetical protein